jgi:hypothetical protein
MRIPHSTYFSNYPSLTCYNLGAFSIAASYWIGYYWGTSFSGYISGYLIDSFTTNYSEIFYIESSVDFSFSITGSSATYFGSIKYGPHFIGILYNDFIAINLISSSNLNILFEPLIWIGYINFRGFLNTNLNSVSPSSYYSFDTNLLYSAALTNPTISTTPINAPL